MSNSCNLVTIIHISQLRGMLLHLKRYFKFQTQSYDTIKL